MNKFWNFIQEILAQEFEESSRLFSPNAEIKKIEHEQVTKIQKLYEPISAKISKNQVTGLSNSEIELVSQAILEMQNYALLTCKYKRVCQENAKVYVMVWSGGSFKDILNIIGIQEKKTSTPALALRTLYHKLLNKPLLLPKNLPTIDGKSIKNDMPTYINDERSTKKPIAFGGKSIKTPLQKKAKYRAVEILKEIFKVNSYASMAKTLRTKCKLTDIPDPPR